MSGRSTFSTRPNSGARKSLKSNSPPKAKNLRFPRGLEQRSPAIAHIRMKPWPTRFVKSERRPNFRSLRKSEEHTSELQSLMRISYAVFCMKKKKQKYTNYRNNSHLQTIKITNT